MLEAVPPLTDAATARLAAAAAQARARRVDLDTAALTAERAALLT